MQNESGNKNSFIKRYAINFTEQDYVVNPAIGREKEIKELALVLLTPDKSAILTGKPGIGKTAIVEGLAYLIQRNEVPDALKGYTIIKVDTQALMGTVKETGDSRVQTLIDEILENEKYILFIDEIHTLINATSDSALDFAQMFKTGLGRGDLKVIGATTTDEYEKYILRDKAFTRRFQKIEVAEPDVEMTVKIVTGVIPRIEKSTGIKMGYTPFIREKLARFVTELTTEYNRVYETAARYPDVAITMFSNAFSEALFDNKDVVTIEHVRKAIEHSKAVYPDVIKKYLIIFDDKFKALIDDSKTSNSDDTYVNVREDLLGNSADPKKDSDLVDNHVNNQASNNSSDTSINVREDLLNNTVQPKNDSLPNIDNSSDEKDDTVSTNDFDYADDIVNISKLSRRIVRPDENEVKEEPKLDINAYPLKEDIKVETIDDLNKVYDRISNPFEALREEK